MRCRGVLLASLLLAAPAGAETVSTTAKTVRLSKEPNGEGAIVSTAGWGSSIRVLQEQHGDDRQLVQIAYPGGNGLDPGPYWVRRSMLMPVESCTLTPVASRERDTRGGGNGAGTFCKTGK
ncbi:hypothetical protein [Thermaurantiacus sp.]